MSSVFGLADEFGLDGRSVKAFVAAQFDVDRSGINGGLEGVGKGFFNRKGSFIGFFVQKMLFLGLFRSLNSFLKDVLVSFKIFYCF